jgi:hypothetical protein
MDNFITHCGLFCELCASKTRIPEQASKLLNTMKNEGYELWGNEISGFIQFWDFLNKLSQKKDCNCRDNSCGYPLCKIRKCAQSKKINVCIECGDYPCELIKDFSKVYPTLITDGERMKKIGYEQWVIEQHKRKESGFQYCDIRCSREK